MVYGSITKTHCYYLEREWGGVATQERPRINTARHTTAAPVLTDHSRLPEHTRPGLAKGEGGVGHPSELVLQSSWTDPSIGPLAWFFWGEGLVILHDWSFEADQPLGTKVQVTYPPGWGWGGAGDSWTAPSPCEQNHTHE